MSVWDQFVQSFRHFSGTHHVRRQVHELNDSLWRCRQDVAHIGGRFDEIKRISDELQEAQAALMQKLEALDQNQKGAIVELRDHQQQALHEFSEQQRKDLRELRDRQQDLLHALGEDQKQGLNRIAARIDLLGEDADIGLRDIMIVLNRTAQLDQHPGIELKTDFAVAVTSDDHKHPRGTRNDNTRHPRFVHKCEEIFGRKVRALDLGCAGGGLVFDFLLRGHEAIGLEGSDYSLRNQRAEWRLLPQHLLTCDITQPFELRERNGGDTAYFDVISAWEVLEHLPEELLPQFFANVSAHLGQDGLFAASIATFEDFDAETGAVYHVTIKSRDWWEQEFRNGGLRPVSGLFEVKDFPRGSGNTPVDWDAIRQPELGFHLVARKS